MYEYPFSNDTRSEGPSGELRLHDITMQHTAQWKDFAPTYRGRPASDAPQLDPAKIEEISIMCRSNFDKQEGDFSLRIQDITAVSSDSSPSSWWAWLWSWFASIFSARKNGRGFVRL